MSSHPAPTSRQVRDAIARSAARLARPLPEPPLRRLAARPGVSVIIPIFNAADALARCLRTIVDSGTPASTEIVLVDDHSGPEVAPIIEAFARAWPRTKTLRNARNLGFVGTVNRGMRESRPEHDVLLLNSDTEVTPGWLPRMSLAAHLDEATATVCALSNAAGVFSIPRAHEDRDLPEGLTPQGAQRALSLVSDRALEAVPSTSGFCMFIKRRAIETVGWFDSALFLRGYGEENDFNERATAAGFVHRVDDSRFVHHARGLSFGSAREQLKRRNSRILQSLHPSHADRLRAFEKSDPLRPVRDRYGALLEELAHASDRSAMLEAPISIVVGGDPPPGEWSARGLRIAVAVRGDAIEVDLFGVTRVRPRSAELARCLYELAHRWDATQILALDLEHAAPARAVAELFGAALSTGRG